MLRNAPERYLFQSAPSVRAPSFTPMSRFVLRCPPNQNAPPIRSVRSTTDDIRIRSGMSPRRKNAGCCEQLKGNVVRNYCIPFGTRYLREISGFPFRGPINIKAARGGGRNGERFARPGLLPRIGIL
jgi:hypothetical protein